VLRKPDGMRGPNHGARNREDQATFADSGSVIENSGSFENLPRTYHSRSRHSKPTRFRSTIGRRGNRASGLVRCEKHLKFLESSLDPAWRLLGNRMAMDTINVAKAAVSIHVVVASPTSNSIVTVRRETSSAWSACSSMCVDSIRIVRRVTRRHTHGVKGEA